MNNILEIYNLNVEFSSSGLFSRKKYFKALDNINISVPRGLSLGIVGESGSGKSTLAKAVARLLDIFSANVRISGDIFFHPGDEVFNINKLNKSRLKNIRKNIQIIFQDPAQSLNPKMTVRELINEPISNFFPFNNKEKSDKLFEWVELTGLNNIDLDSYPYQISGGQKQRVAIARSLCVNPSVLIADEIVSALDVSVQGQILNLILDLKEKLKLTLIFISHDLSVIRNVADYVIVMNKGEIVEEGDVEKIFSAPDNNYTKQLLNSVPKIKYSQNK